MVGIVIARAQHTAKIRAKSLNVSNKTYYNHHTPMQWNGSCWPKVHLPATLIDPILNNKACCSFLLKESNYSPYIVCDGSTVNKLLKLWVFKLSFLKRHPSIQKSKILKYRALVAVKEKTPSDESTPPLWLIQYRKKSGSNYRLSMESNYRPYRVSDG
jgi:hypothetical protein